MAADDAGIPLRARKKLEARRRILSISRRLILSRGYAETTMREVARAAGVSYQTLYNYFPTKGEILRTLLNEQAENLARRYDNLLFDRETDLPEALDALNTLLFAAVADGDRELWRIATLEYLRQPEDPVRVFRLVDGTAHEQQKRLLVLAQNRGELADEVHLSILTDVLLDLADHALLRFILNPERPVDAALEALGTQMRLVLSPHLVSDGDREKS
jgi:AcrR family transcriptional regulator